MSIHQFFGLSALDLRIVPPSDPVLLKKITSSVPIKSRWSTLEFKFYILVFVTVIPLMFKQVIDISLPSHPNYEKFSYMLSDGWIFGRKVDNSDVQYSFFRNNFILLMILCLLHVSLKYLMVNYFKLIKKLKFDLIFGLIFIFFAHGFNCFKILFHILVNYLVVKSLISLDKKNNFKENKNIYKKMAISFIWIYGIAALFVNDKYRDFQVYQSINKNFEVLDNFKGIIERWDIFFNFTLLRIISYNMDYIWRYYDLKEYQEGSNGIQLKQFELTSETTTKKRSDTLNQRELNLLSKNDLTTSTYPGVDLNDKERQNYPWSIIDYNFQNHLSYILYTPLFICGPILSFNDYLYQTCHTLSSISLKRNLVYGLRFLIDVLSMEIILHYMYVVAIAKVKFFDNYTPFQISMIGLFNLNVIWLKLLIPWRFFRFWSLLDNIDPPENMIRCVNNNYSALGFWRAWHRSFNKWTTRYIYIPLGGRDNRILTSLAVFSFVAVWHDIELKLLIWGWLIVLFLLPEIFLSNFFAKNFNHSKYYRHICGVGSVVNIWLMMIANIYGFCLGHDGTIELLQKMLYTINGAVFFITCSGCLFVATQVMYEQRESEKRRGIDIRC